jgi:hypothetical protein
MKRISVVEGQKFRLPAGDVDGFRAAVSRLKVELKPQVPILTESDGFFTLQNVIGTVRVSPQTLIQVSPKVGQDCDWVSATLDLLLPNTRLHATGSRASSPVRQRRDLLDALAELFETSLRRAVYQDGPLLTLERRSAELGGIKGKLDVTRWLQHVAQRPYRFPVSFDELTVDNEYTRAIEFVAGRLAYSVSSPRLRSALLELKGVVRPGCIPVASVDPQIASRAIPRQWAVYGPVWDVTQVVLSRSSPLRSSGARSGLEIAIEAWPLLETLLTRALDAAVQEAKGRSRELVSPGRRHYALLTKPSAGGLAGTVVPDGQLDEAGQTVASFEAKYSSAMSSGVEPQRGHIFQALSTAAALGSPLAVLIYPNEFEPIWWNVNGFHGFPERLVALGMDLFSYVRGPGDVKRGRAILDILEAPPSKVFHDFLEASL